MSGVTTRPHSGANALDAVKFFTSIKWKSKFADIAAQFAAQKSDLQSDLQLHTSITGSKTFSLVASVDDKMTTMTAMMELVFEKLQTPEERELAAFSHRNGGQERVLENGVLMKRVLEKQKVATRADKSSTHGKGGVPTQTTLTVPELERELRKDVDSILSENTSAFERKFGAMELSLREVNVTIQHQSDRVISEVLAGVQAGPHERIKDMVRSPGLQKTPLLISHCRICITYGKKW